ncbi:MAG TPA: glycosyltransferase family 39 protein, partial [Roseiflexaceae bacterium]
MNTQRRLSIALSGSKWPLLGLLALLIATAWVEPLLIHRSFPRTIEIGGHDLGLAQGWSAKEISDTLPGPNGPVSAVYRWSGPTSSLVVAPAAQRQPYAVTLRLLSGRPGGRAVAPVKLSAGDHPLATFSVGPTLRRYDFLVPGAFVQGGSLILRLDTPTFTPPDDDRVLGLIGLDARMEQAGAAIWLPGPTLVLCLLGLAALLFANARSLKLMLPVVALALAAIVPIGLFAPQYALEAARTLAWLFLIAALIVGGARWWRRSGRRLRHPWRWAAALLLLLTALLFTPGMSADGVEYYAYLRSLAVDHDIEFTDEFKGPEVPFDRVPEWLATNRGPTGYAQNLASVGPAIVWAPFYLIGSLVVRGGNAFGADWTTDGYSLPYIAMINLASVVSLPITVWLCYLIARRYADHGIALLTAISLVAGSAIIDYGLFEAHFPHALAAAAVAAYFAWWLRTRPDRTLRQWVVLGLLAGLMALMYWINAILLLLPALDLLPPFWRALKGGSRTAPTRAIDGSRTAPTRAIGGMIGGGLTFMAATLLAFSPQMLAWKILYGSPFTIPHGASFAEPRGFKALEMLFSPVHGQLLWAPITFVALVGMGWYIVRWRWEGALVLLAFALYFLYNATLGSWHGGGPFGLRRIANVLPLLTPGLACLLVWLARRGRESPLTLCALCLTWNVALLLRYLGYLIPHHPGELGTLTVGEFVLAPNNLPWYKLPLIVGNALFPRLLIQGAGNPAGGEWVPFGLLLGATILVVVVTIAALAWLHRRAAGA